MLAVLFLIRLAIFTGLACDDGPGAYEVVLRSLRADHPTAALYLVNLPKKRYTPGRESPSEGELLHDRRWVAGLERSVILAGSCTPPEHEMACARADSRIGQSSISVVFWPINEAPGESLKVTVTLALPPTRPEVPLLEKREYTLERTDGSHWRVVSHSVVGVS